MSREYPCVYYRGNGLCRYGGDESDANICVFGPCENETPSNGDKIRTMSDVELAEYIQNVQLDTARAIKEQEGLTGKLAFAQTLPELVKWLGCPADVEADNVLDFDTTRPRPDFVFRAEKELQKAANDLESAARRGAPQVDIFNLQRKVEYKQYILGLMKGMVTC